MGKTRRTISLREEMARNGELNAQYTQTNFLKFKPAYNIDAVIFSFVEIGQHGKGFDIFVKLDIFDILCDDILDRTLYKKLQAEQPSAQNPYPCSFQYITGDKGDKEIKISRGKKSDCNIYGRCGNNYMNIPFSYNELRITAKWFKRTSAQRFKELTGMTLQALREQASYYANSKNDVDIEVNSKQNHQGIFD